MTEFTKQAPCATACFYQWEGACSNDLVGANIGCQAGCIAWATNDCYCRTDYQSYATSYLYTCVSKGCTHGDPALDISSATSIYNAHCLKQGYTPATTTADSLPGATTATVYVTVTVTKSAGARELARGALLGARVTIVVSSPARNLQAWRGARLTCVLKTFILLYFGDFNG